MKGERKRRKSQFQKGHIPWNQGISLPQTDSNQDAEPKTTRQTVRMSKEEFYLVTKTAYDGRSRCMPDCEGMTGEAWLLQHCIWTRRNQHSLKILMAWDWLTARKWSKPGIRPSRFTEWPRLTATWPTWRSPMRKNGEFTGRWHLTVLHVTSLLQNSSSTKKCQQTDQAQIQQHQTWVLALGYKIHLWVTEEHDAS